MKLPKPPRTLLAALLLVPLAALGSRTGGRHGGRGGVGKR
jgi:hypothetical protein